MDELNQQNGFPDFIIIGAMKSATTTLQEQLAAQPGIFLTEPKEPNFFSDDEQYARGINWYRSLFTKAPAGSLTGEASTHYTKMPTYLLALDRLASVISDPQLVYVMRHPVDRFVSHYIHEWSMNNVHCTIDEAVEQHPEMVEYGCYDRQISPWLTRFGPDRILPVFFDRLVSAPQKELARVCRHIGYSGTPQWLDDLAPSNVSSERIRRFPGYGTLVESDLATWLRRHLIPKAMRNRVKRGLRMNERPKLSADTRRQLEARFDADLASLGQKLGCALSCSNFRELTASQPLDWKR